MGKRTKVYIDENLKKELQKYATEVSIGIAAKVRDDLTDKAASAIDAFYRDYEPKSYSRNYYNFKENSFKKYYQNAHGSIIRGGVELTPNELEPIYAANPLVVFNAVYSGIHGFPTVTSPMSPSPYEIITNYRDGIINNINDYKKYGIDRARKNKYTMFHY